MPSVPPPGRDADITDLMRASGMIGLKARRVTRTSEGGFVVLGGRLPDGRLRIVDPVTSVEAGDRRWLPPAKTPVRDRAVDGALTGVSAKQAPTPHPGTRPTFTDCRSR